MTHSVSKYTTIHKHLVDWSFGNRFSKELLLWASIKRDYGRRVSSLRIDELAKIHKVHPKTIQRRLNKLVERGWLIKTAFYYYTTSQAKVLAHEGINVPPRVKAVRLFQGNESVDWLYGAIHTAVGQRIRSSDIRQYKAGRRPETKVSCTTMADELGRSRSWVSRRNRSALANKHILYTKDFRELGALPRQAIEYMGLAGRVFLKDGIWFERLANIVELKNPVLREMGVTTYEWSRQP